MFELTGFQRDLIIIISGLDEPNGLEIKEETDDYYESEINHGRLYPNLNTLIDEGLLNKEKADERTNKYELTKSGRQAIKERREWEEQYVDID
ncbi:helix-turn-helix transcriptional regulator [Halodesulfurarchaeum sp. HSR-GB]|uniref:PadR family transcriptional regulator n=1 Tax=Halodesulfurarchaeum sp. HSR-GB TaxID=3074077 RepID=UPI0028602536|nr:helix-turn-helix transcriptional regulator [Halodesulfurarchaeum sp. HSR-GB]MDR5657679.1 helix-turn-helix transcriptional regulator [Halodesulfurarchaeum sp. HSR-GB]